MQAVNDVARAIRRVTWWGFVINLLLAAAKSLVGWAGQSQALIADGVHSLSDCITDFAVIIGAPIWSAPADDDHPHGHGRIETVVTFGIAAVLAFAGIGLGYSALTTLRSGDIPTPSIAVVVVALLSIISKEAVYRWTLHVGKQTRSTALTANAWHHRTDALSSVPVLIASIGTWIAPGWTFLDPVATVLVGAMILHAAWQIGWPALLQLTDQGANKAERRQILEIAMTIDGVRDVHALRTRHIGTGLQTDLHVLVDPDATVREGHAIAGRVKQAILEQSESVIDVLIHVEPHEEGG